MGGSPRFRLYGVTMETSWPLITELLSSSESPDLRFSVVETAPGEGTWNADDGLADPGPHADDVLVGMIGTFEVIRFPRVGDAWLIGEDGIVFHLTHPEHHFQIEVVLLGILIGYWLERSGKIALHAAAVSRDGTAIGFMGPNGAGKTSLALDLIDHGFRLVTDDLLAVSIAGPSPTAHSSFPQVRLWPDEARERLGSIGGLRKVHARNDKLRVPLSEEQFSDRPATLIALYSRTPHPDADRSITRVTGPNALFHLMFNSFAFGLLDAPRTRKDWIRRLGSLLQRVPVFTVPRSADLRATAELVAEHALSLAGQSNPSG